MLHARPSARLAWNDLDVVARERLDAVLVMLGYRLAPGDLRPGPWDMQLTDGTFVELDEENHFTRYRAMALQSPWAQSLPWGARWAEYCRDYEGKAQARGAYWHTARAGQMFGASDPPRSFKGGGSARWKQRALYDSMKDLAAASGSVSLARLSIYDKIDGVPLGQRLRTGSLATAALRDLVAQRRVAAVGGRSYRNES